MKAPNGELLMYVLLFVGGGIYLLTGLPTTQPRPQIFFGVVAVALIVIGLLLLFRFRWSSELFLAACVFFFVWATIRFVLEGYNQSRLLGIVGAIMAMFGYPTLRRHTRGSDG